MTNRSPASEITLRAPHARDGAALHRLIAACPPLDTNSMYCNLLQCSHFSDTTVVAEMDGDIVGAVSGYLIPGRPDTLFVWQVASAPAARGQGLGGRMIRHILARPGCASVTHIETTVTGDNAASWAMFERLAAKLGAGIERSTLFEKDTHFNGEHEAEILARIGPIAKDPGKQTPTNQDNAEQAA